ncbi:hypothetical protein [Thiolapillus sp.]|uniref:hypothetical protein n=1 Tax=Thiolapillus sp. TaxID=2017437 RepID=UPI0025CE18A9|nr:hypothetical protein [Thiolapillus sp.]
MLYQLSYGGMVEARMLIGMPGKVNSLVENCWQRTDLSGFPAHGVPILPGEGTTDNRKMRTVNTAGLSYGVIFPVPHSAGQLLCLCASISYRCSFFRHLPLALSIPLTAVPLRIPLVRCCPLKVPGGSLPRLQEILWQQALRTIRWIFNPH